MQVWPKSFQPIVFSVRAFFQRHGKRLLQLRERFRFREETFHLLVAGAVGVVGGLTNLIFHFCYQFITLTVLGAQTDLLTRVHELNLWQRLLIPTAGGLAAGLVLQHGLRLLGPQGPANLLEVVVAGDGRLRLRSALVKAASSLLTISTGGSIGREGSITQLSATFASKLGQLAHWQPYRLRLLVACGAASGISAAYNAPITGAVFASQIVLGNFSMNFFAPVVFASVVATMVSRSFLGMEPWYKVPPFEFTRWTQLPWFVVLGILSGVLGAIFMKLLDLSKELFTQLRLSIYLRLALGGAIVGALSLVYPDVWGNGYEANNRILHHELTVGSLVGLFGAKSLATLVTVGCGAVGGLITPTLFLGASFGSLFGTGLDWMNWSATPATTYALVGMGSVLAATIHSPLLAMIMVFEISLNYSLMPPLMLACTVATLTARSIHPDSVYTEPLRRKGVELERESQQLGAATQKTVADLMREPVPPIREIAPFQEISDRFLTSPNNFIPVVDGANRLLGVVALQDLKEHLKAGAELNMLIAYDIMRPPPACLTPNQRLLDVLPIFLRSELLHIPVVNTLKDFQLVGTVVRSEGLGILSEAIAARST